MILRLGITLTILTIGCGAYVVGTKLQTRHVREAGSTLLGNLQPGIPAIIYFWSRTCTPCKLVQKPALDALQAQLGLGALQIVAVDALERPDVADEWGVLSLPTTFIVDRWGEPRRVNHGVIREGQLRQQIEALD